MLTSIRAALVHNSVLYVFDMSPISADEENVVYSELHIYKRRRWSRKFNRSPRWPDVNVAVSVYELMPSSLALRTSLTISERSAGWQTLNVTDVVSTCVDGLGYRSTPPKMMAVGFAHMVWVSSHIGLLRYSSESPARNSLTLHLFYGTTSVTDNWLEIKKELQGRLC